VRFIADVGAYLPFILAAFAAAGAIALVATPFVRRLALRHRVLDRPDHRRVNTRPVPRAGGLAVVAGFVAVGAVFAILASGAEFVPRPRFIELGELVALLAGGLIAGLIGGLDDWFDLRARWQLAGQIALAGFAVALGIGVGAINNPFGPGTIAFEGLFAAGFTMVWIVGMINSINFIDGLDGLSSGIALIAAVTLGVISLTTQIGQPYIAVLCFAFAGALLGFLRWNFHPAAIFAGTSGVMFIGYTLAVLSILGSAKVAVALLVLAVPIIDTFWIIVRRLASGRSPFTPDRGHIHHRLLDLGLTHRQTVLLIYAICAALGILSLGLSGANQVYAFLGVLVGFGLVLLVLTRGEAEDALEADSYEDVEPATRS
jgi:UDP-GlcNAc:undecaprenyl-phosphate GlcNAc-1-phosphate transferase